jgi:hypothetical protein
MFIHSRFNENSAFVLELSGIHFDSRKIRISLIFFGFLAYLLDPTATSSPIIHEPPSQASNRVDSILSYLDEANHNGVIIESVRSQKTSAREISSPATVRFTTPPQSTRQQQQAKKLAQSVSVPHIRASPSVDQQAKHGTKVKKSYFLKKNDLI